MSSTLPALTQRPTLLQSSCRPTFTFKGADSLPGPTTYVGDDRLLARHVTAPKATFGRGPGHTPPGGGSHIPGPADYASSLRSSNRQSAIMGTGPGHGNKVKSTPGPTDYATAATPKRIPGGNYFSSTKRGRSATSAWFVAGAADERRRFRQMDSNGNGVLDFGEVWALFLRGDRDVKEIEVRKLFQAMDADDDGHIQVDELLEFLHSDSLQFSLWRKKLQAALELARPGPCDYDTAKARQKRTASATMGTGPGHGDSLPDVSPGPSFYSVNYASVQANAPAATIGCGPGHDASDRQTLPSLGRPVGTSRTKKNIHE